MGRRGWAGSFLLLVYFQLSSPLSSAFIHTPAASRARLFPLPSTSRIVLADPDGSSCRAKLPLPVRFARCRSPRAGTWLMGKKKRGGGGGAKKGSAKGKNLRADALLVERGLAEDERHALSLILQRKVVADEGKVIVEKAGQMVPKDMPLRLKGSQPGADRGAGTTQGAPEEGGVRLGPVRKGLVVAHHGSRVVVEAAEDEDCGAASGASGEEGDGGGVAAAGESEVERGAEEAGVARYTCPLTPGLKEVGVITGDEVEFRAAIGDMVGESGKSAGERGVVLSRLPRRGVLERPTKALADVNWGSLQALGGEKLLEVTKGRKFMCANADLMMVVVAPQPGTVRLLLDAYLVGAHYSGMDAVLVLNKCDTIPEPDAAHPSSVGDARRDHAQGGRDRDALTSYVSEADLAVYRAIGYRTVCTSTRSGEGLEELQRLLRGHTSIMIGQSGVGKSSLLNALLPKAKARVGALANTGMGAHTTSHAELHRLEEGARVIDCAGFRDFGLWHLSTEDVHDGFREIARAAEGCKFRDCLHRDEPEGACQVKRLAGKGEIDPLRLASFHRLTGFR